MDRRMVTKAVVFVVLVAAAIASRFADIAPNFAAVSAAALFAGFLFRSGVAGAGVAALALALSDPFLGAYPWYQAIAVYACLMVPALFGSRMGRSAPWAHVLGSSLAASIIFFVVTNFAVWAGGVYGYSASDLARCYIAALPFFKYTLAGDACFAVMFFGAWRLAAAMNRVAPAARVA